MNDTRALLTAALRAMDTAAYIAKHHKTGIAHSKGDRDMVTDLDIEIERVVRARLKQDAPDIAFLGEEESPASSTKNLTWALDPIDGTANLVHNIPLYAISLALVQEDRPLLGIIDLPMLGQRYWAAKGQGAWLRGKRIQVSRRDRLADAMVTIGDYAVGSDATAKNRLRLNVTAELARQVLRVRMLGSAAIDLAWLAEGKTDACILLSNKPWDTAAGVIIAAEAGAQVVDLDGSMHTMRSKAAIAAEPSLIAEIISLIHRSQTLDSDRALCDPPTDPRRMSAS
jgi:myo-inositol-1(or 4)-monophosphatase